MMASQATESALAEFQLSDEEALALAAAKLWFMQSERDLDPDEDDRIEKDLVCLEYALALHRMCQQELKFDADDVPAPRPSALIARTEGSGWPAAIRRALGDVDFDEARDLLTNRAVVESLLKQVSSRPRAVLLMVELSAFYPWPKGVKFEKDQRRHLLDDIARTLPAMDAQYARELDHELSRRMLKMKVRGLSLVKIGVIAGTGAVIGVITGGLAATAIGGAIGATMGLSGAAAVNAGLALLGGGSLAAGGLGVAGGTLVVTSVAGVGGGAIGASGATAYGLRSEAVLVDMVKLDVLTEYVLIREKSQPQKARMVAASIESRLRTAEVRQDDIESEMGEAQRLAVMLTATMSHAAAAEAERDDALEELGEAHAKIDRLEEEKKELKQSVKYWKSGLHSIEHAVRA